MEGATGPSAAVPASSPAGMSPATGATLPHRVPGLSGFGQNGPMAVLDDCRHYIMQTTAHEEKVEKCRMGANEPFPFACPENCLFYEPRKVSGAGWTVRNPDDPQD